MRRYGENIKRKIKYKIRVGVYGVISVGNKILLTDQDGEEIQLPGGGVDQGEHKIHALIREVHEETGWKINPIRHLGCYQRFVFMPEYALWAQKICHIYYCKFLSQHKKWVGLSKICAPSPIFAKICAPHYFLKEHKWSFRAETPKFTVVSGLHAGFL